MKLSKGFKTLKKCMAFLMVLTLLITVPTFEGKDAVAAPTDVVEIPDAGLKNYLYRILGKDATETVTQEELASITKVYVSSTNGDVVSDLTGLEYCTNLTYLYLNMTGDVDLTPISNLSNVNELTLRSDGKIDLSTLGGLANVEDVTISCPDGPKGIDVFTKVNDLTISIQGAEEWDSTGLLNLTSLEKLVLSSTKRVKVDIDNIKNLTNLTYLNISNISDDDYSCVSNFTKLKELYIENTDITAVPDLSAMTSLETAEFEYNRSLKDISGVSGCTSLTRLNFDDSPYIEKYDALEGLVNLTVLRLEKANVTEENSAGFMKAISSLTNLEAIYLGYSDITDEHTSMFDPLTKLKTMELGMCEISDVDFLLKHKDTLETITLHSNPVGNNDVFEQLTELKVLGLGGTHVYDFSFISKLPNFTSGCIRYSEWNDPGENFTDNFTTTTNFKAGDYKVYDSELPYTFVVDNLVKDENGNPIAPMDSENYTYDASTNKITFILEEEDFSSWNDKTTLRVQYKFSMTTQKGHKLYASHVMSYNVESVVKFEIVQQPKSYDIDEGEVAYLSVGARAENAISYQWYKDGEPISNTSRTCYLYDAELDDAGEYYVVLSDGTDTIISEKVTVTVNKIPLVITAQPDDIDITEGTKLSLYAYAIGKGDVSYQWYKDGQLIAGATSNNFVINEAELDDAGKYYVVVSDVRANLSSEVVTVTVNERATTEEETTTATEEETTTSTEDETTAATTEKVDEEPVTGDVSTFGLVALLVLMALAGVTSFKLRNKI